VAFRFVAALNVATAVWLTVMFLILRHPGFELNALMTLGIAAFCALAFWSARAHVPVWMRTASLIGSLALGVCGGWAIYQDLQPGAHFEGFILVIGAMWIGQAATAITAQRRPT